jgi:zinc D-Ala-D-Ala dipeptidase
MLPDGFVYLSHAAPDIRQEIRYAGTHNFIGRPVDGYFAAECVLTHAAARALARVQARVSSLGCTLKVYDGYRPQRAVDEFVAWSADPRDQAMKAEFYPTVDKSRVFELGYVAAKSGHSRGSTVDLTIERLTHAPLALSAPTSDASIDMGTCFDCMGPLSHEDAHVGAVAEAHRRLLHEAMNECGFSGIHTEWWHYTLRDEPFPGTYFDFPIVAP